MEIKVASRDWNKRLKELAPPMMDATLRLLLSRQSTSKAKTLADHVLELCSKLDDAPDSTRKRS